MVCLKKKLVRLFYTSSIIRLKSRKVGKPVVSLSRRIIWQTIVNSKHLYSFLSLLYLPCMRVLCSND